MVAFTNQDKWNNFRAVLECAVAIHASTSDPDVIDDRSSLIRASTRASVLEEQKDLITATLFQQQLSENNIWKNEDPSAYYDVYSQEKLGVGGFARVYKVLRKADKKQFALKFCTPSTDEDREMMFHEVALMRMCATQSICLHVEEAYNDAQRNILWIFIELMDCSITNIIKGMRVREEYYTENALRWILRQSLKGLHYLHARNIVHRDIKSDNILTNKAGDVKLADFGYSAQLTQERSARSSKVGTLCWMAPELIKGERRYDTKIDIWSYGIFAFELAEGDPPYIREPQSRIMINIITRDPPQISSRWSQNFRDFVSLCLTTDPEQRPSAKDLLQHPFLQGPANKWKEAYASMVNTYVIDRAEAKARKKAEAKAARRLERQREKEQAKLAASTRSKK